MLNLKRFNWVLSTRFKSFITTPIFYVNADPHIGHLYSAVLADAAHRWALLKAGKRIDEKASGFLFSTGTDEHGIKVQSAAQRAGQNPIDYCGKYSDRFRSLFDLFNISYTDFIRTTEERHKKAVEAFWERLLNKNLIQKSLYEGWYSTIDECFYSEKDVENFVENGIETKIYVWFDALINYLSVTGFPQQTSELWPPEIQFIGKDILKFHAIYWPCFLLAADLPLPKKLFVHGHWLVNGLKMSKSRGNVIEPIKASQILSVDGLRYFLLKQGVPHEDTNFTQLKAVQVVNADLVNNLGNLLSRTTVAKINPKQKYPDAFDLNSLDPELRIVCDHLTKNLKTLPEKVGKLYDSLLFYKALELIAETSNLANVFFQHSNAWKKDPSINLSTTLFLTYESIRLCALLIQPIVPSYADRILSRLGISKNERDLNTAIFGGESTIKLYGRDLGKDNGVVMERIKLENLDPSIVSKTGGSR